MNKQKFQPQRKFKTSELSAISSHIENLMVSPLLGIEKSLILHRNKKMIKPILEEVDEKIKVIQRQCYKTDKEGNLELDEAGKMIPLKGKLTEYSVAYSKVMGEVHEVVFLPINLSELPSPGDFGKINNLDIYQFIPPLFDIVFFEASTFEEVKSQIKE